MYYLYIQCKECECVHGARPAYNPYALPPCFKDGLWIHRALTKIKLLLKINELIYSWNFIYNIKLLLFIYFLWAQHHWDFLGQPFSSISGRSMHLGESYAGTKYLY